MISGIFALIGAVLGSGLTFFAARWNSIREGQAESLRSLRLERMVAFSSLAASIMQVRRSQFNRWYQRSSYGSASSENASAKADAYQMRALAWEALYRAELLGPSDTVELARQAIDLAGSMHRAVDRSEVDSMGEDVRRAVEQFISSARASL